MNKMHKTGLVLILVLFMFDFLLLLFGIKAGKEGEIVIFNLILFSIGAALFTYE